MRPLELALGSQQLWGHAGRQMFWGDLKDSPGPRLAEALRRLEDWGPCLSWRWGGKAEGTGSRAGESQGISKGQS